MSENTCQAQNHQIDEIISRHKDRDIFHPVGKRGAQRQNVKMPDWVVRIECRLNSQEQRPSLEMEENRAYRKGKLHGFQLNLVNKAYYYVASHDLPMPYEHVVACYAKLVYAIAGIEIGACRFSTVVASIKDSVFENILSFGDEERCAYLSGLHDGCAATMLDSDNTDILNFMYVLWPSIVKLKSVTQLWTVLTKEFGPQFVGDKKRIENICRRYGIRLGKPGRPKKQHQSPKV